VKRVIDFIYRGRLLIWELDKPHLTNPLPLSFIIGFDVEEMTH
jgi:hypothetical protein